MKKSSIFCILIASLIMVTGCKKDQDTVTLSAVINQPSKVFINSDRYPCWESGDNIYVNDAAYPVSDVNTSNRTVARWHHPPTAIVPSILPASSLKAPTSLTTLCKSIYLPFKNTKEPMSAASHIKKSVFPWVPISQMAAPCVLATSAL